MAPHLHHLGVLALFPTLLGCAQLPGFSRSAEPPAQTEIAVQATDAETLRPQARPDRGVRTLGAAGLRPEALDQTSAEERAAALAPAATRTQLLGETLASLGNPADPGLWLRTGLVTRVTQGRIELKQGNGSLNIELRPSGAPAGGGSQLSLAAFTSLGLPLTQLVDLHVYAE